VAIGSVDDLYETLPHVHRGGTHTFHIAKQVAHAIDGLVDRQSRTLETGCGLSTALFAVRGTRHTCVTRFQEEVDRISAYLKAHDIDNGRITFVVGNSQDVLPSLRIEPVDVVLIDGQHAFPIPFIDWYYCNQLLRTGGTMIVDDTQIWTGRILRQFLSAQPELRRSNDFFGRAASFQKLGHADAEGWAGQPLVARRSRAPRLAERVRRRLAVAVERIPNEHNAKAAMSPDARRMADGTP